MTKLLSVLLLTLTLVACTVEAQPTNQTQEIRTLPSSATSGRHSKLQEGEILLSDGRTVLCVVYIDSGLWSPLGGLSCDWGGAQ